MVFVKEIQTLYIEKVIEVYHLWQKTYQQRGLYGRCDAEFNQNTLIPFLWQYLRNVSVHLGKFRQSIPVIGHVVSTAISHQLDEYDTASTDCSISPVTCDEQIMCLNWESATVDIPGDCQEWQAYVPQRSCAVNVSTAGWQLSPV